MFRPPRAGRILARRVAVVNEAFVRRHFRDASALGRRFRWSFAAMLAALATLGPFSIDASLSAINWSEPGSAEVPGISGVLTFSAYTSWYALSR